MIQPQSMPAFVMPTRTPHDEYLRLALKTVAVGTLASLPMLLSTSLLALVGEKTIPAALAIPTTVIFVCSAGTLVVAVRLIVRSHAALDHLFAEWQDWQSVNRECALSRAGLEINISGGRGNRVLVNQAQTNNTLNLGGTETPAETRLKFLRHVEEFYRRAQAIGVERGEWLLADGAGSNYRFTRDGETLSREEYEDIMKLLVASGKVTGRRKGRTGDLAREPLVLPKVLPTPPVPAGISS